MKKINRITDAAGAPTEQASCRKTIPAFGFKRELYEFKLLMRSIPSLMTTMFIMSVVIMNLLANKSISLPFDWLALDCGIIVSWISFLSMDIITKHFGPKAATEVSLAAVAVNLFVCALLYLSSIVPGVWGESFVEHGGDAINAALNNTFGGTWYVLLGSTIAFASSAVVNNFVNYAVGKTMRSDGFFAYACRSYVSTAIGQFTDNIVFALIVSHFFFGWSLLQCVTCAATGMVAELLCEALFSHLGYTVCKKWSEDGVGAEYLALSKERSI